MRAELSHHVQDGHLQGSVGAQNCLAVGCDVPSELETAPGVEAAHQLGDVPGGETSEILSVRLN